jgi:membrane protease subunit HflK
VRDPDETVRAAAESAVRQVIGNRRMDDSFGQLTALSAESQSTLQAIIDQYTRESLKVASDQTVQPFFTISEFNFQNVRPPPEVKDAFDDAIAAREDKDRIEKEAEAYRSRVVPEARGQAARVRAESEGARDSQIAVAEGEGERFRLLASQYRLAPEITRKRLMLETMQEVLTGSPKVVVEGGGENVLYLPLDQISRGVATGGGNASSPVANSPAAAAPSAPVVESIRGREGGRTAREGGRN